MPMWWPALEFLLLTFGVVLLAVEILVIPGFGATGVTGIALLLGGAYVGWREVSDLGSLVSVSMALGALDATVKIAPRFIDKESLVLESDRATATAVPENLSGLVGFGGTVVTPLRPAGTARIGGRTVDV